MAEPSGEAEGIDGFVGDTPVSVKPASYRSKKMLPEVLEAVVGCYTERRRHPIVEFDFRAPRVTTPSRPAR
jgi:hypothetical protein